MWFYLLFFCICPVFTTKYTEYKTSSENLIFFPFHGNRINFMVKGPRDASISLTADPHSSTPMFEIIIGNYKNTYSYIKTQDHPSSDVYVYTYNILDPDTYRGFWIQVDYSFNTRNFDGWHRLRDTLTISFGHEGNPNPILTKYEKLPEFMLNVNFYAISGNGLFWLIQDSPCLTPHVTSLVHRFYNPDPEPTYDNEYCPVTKRKIRFSVKSDSESTIILIGHERIMEIVLGTSDNTKSMIRVNKTMVVSMVYTSYILYGSEFRKFWIELSRSEDTNAITSASIRVGRQDTDEAILSYTDPNPFEITFYSYTNTGSHDKAIWIFEKFNDPPVYQGHKYISTKNEINSFYDQFYNVTKNFMRFKVRTTYDANIAFTSKPYDSNPMYEIIIGRRKENENKNDKRLQALHNIIMKNRQATLAKDIDFYDDKKLDQKEYHEFWVKIITTNSPDNAPPAVQILVGYEYESQPFLNMTDHKGFEIKYYSVATRGPSGSSFWILEDDTLNNEEDKVIEKKVDLVPPSLNNSIKFFPVYSNVLQIKVKATSNACIVLTSHPNYEDKNNILIKLKDYSKQLDQYVNAITKNDLIKTQYNGEILWSKDVYSGFWIKFTNTTNNGRAGILIRVGRDGEDFPLLAWTGENPYAINYFGINSYNKNDGSSWIIKERTIKPTQIQYEDDVYTMGDNEIRYFAMKTEFVRFKVQAKSDAIIFLVPSETVITPNIKIVLGHNRNTENLLIPVGRDQEKTDGGLLHPTKLTEFWIQLDYFEDSLMTLHLGRGGETQHVFKHVSESPFPVNYIGFTTSKVDGTWSIPIFEENKIVSLLDYEENGAHLG